MGTWTLRVILQVAQSRGSGFRAIRLMDKILHDPKDPTVNPEKLEHGFRRIGARIPYTLP